MKFLKGSARGNFFPKKFPPHIIYISPSVARFQQLWHMAT